VSYDAPDEKRIGKDGKSYPVNKPRKSEKEPPENYQAAFFLRVDLAVTAKRECEQLVGYGAMTPHVEASSRCGARCRKGLVRVSAIFGAIARNCTHRRHRPREWS
jgi:hypothetical protein